MRAAAAAGECPLLTPRAPGPGARENRGTVSIVSSSRPRTAIGQNPLLFRAGSWCMEASHAWVCPQETQKIRVYAVTRARGAGAAETHSTVLRACAAAVVQAVTRLGPWRNLSVISPVHATHGLLSAVT